MTKTVEELRAIADKMLKLPTADKLTMAVALLRQGNAQMAETVIEAALEDLQLRRLLSVERAPLR